MLSSILLFSVCDLSKFIPLSSGIFGIVRSVLDIRPQDNIENRISFGV